ncbi:Uncharacterized protein TCAP_04031 [Tolypocladium capitatum]|uniref:Uncharacterized protein n=1 Tax=Tolypocladium capitatum TaxID=45235 RepID=A0A2K3QES0_9HYPO|nr:Uncharacterized protein TCAP_04031 [Tolypocladium capitatum]
MSPAVRRPAPEPEDGPCSPQQQQQDQQQQDQQQQDQQQQQHRPQPAADKVPLPKLRLEVRDLAHPGAPLFLDSVNATRCLTTAIANLLRLLYTTPPAGPGSATVPPTRSVTLILRDMSGVAYTTGSDLDNDHKEIHFSLSYLEGIPAARAAREIAGVVTHELVHCYQYDGFGTCPGGLIEGVADWVRLRCGLAPPHWVRDAAGSWDAGYQKTAYFLDYLEGRFGNGLVRRVNEKLRVKKYDEAAFWTELTGASVDVLWKAYGESLKTTPGANGGS